MSFKISAVKQAEFVARHKAEMAERRAVLIASLEAKVAEKGPDSSYAEMLAELKEK